LQGITELVNTSFHIVAHETYHRRCYSFIDLVRVLFLLKTSSRTASSSVLCYFKVLL
jgi:hypothetical protein